MEPQVYSPNNPNVQNPDPAYPSVTVAPKPGKSRVLLVAGIVTVVILLALVVLLAILSSQKKKPAATATKSQASASLNDSPPALQPAQPIDVEQAKNSILQDMSGANDDQDLPKNRLDDKTLGLSF